MLIMVPARDALWVEFSVIIPAITMLSISRRTCWRPRPKSSLIVRCDTSNWPRSSVTIPNRVWNACWRKRAVSHIQAQTAASCLFLNKGWSHRPRWARAYPLIAATRRPRDSDRRCAPHGLRQRNIVTGVGYRSGATLLNTLLCGCGRPPYRPPMPRVF